MGKEGGVGRAISVKARSFAWDGGAASRYLLDRDGKTEPFRTGCGEAASRKLSLRYFKLTVCVKRESADESAHSKELPSTGEICNCRHELFGLNWFGEVQLIACRQGAFAIFARCIAG